MPDGRSAPNKRILVVDDEPAVLSISGQVLERLGYKVETYSYGMYTLASFERKLWSFDLVITDGYMPSVTGEELADKICRYGPICRLSSVQGMTETASRETDQSVEY